VNKKAPSPRYTFTNGFADEFTVPIPETFSDALRKEEFSNGDVIYSSRAAYRNPDWSEVVKQTAWAIQIKESMTGGRTVFFELLRRSEDSTKLILDGKYKLHWDDFLQRLKTGDFQGIERIGI
jgi:hypothetical protein